MGALLYAEPSDFRRPDSWWYSGYCQMKWINGELMRWLGGDGALSATLSVTPYVLGSTRGGRDPGQHYSWWRVIEVAKSIGCIWDGPGMNYCPVDVLADALVVNAMRNEPLAELLPCNPVPYDNRLFSDLIGLDLVDYEVFHARASRLVSPRRLGALLSSSLDELTRTTNRTAILPPGLDESWCDHRQLYRMYLDNIDFRDVSVRRRFAGQG